MATPFISIVVPVFRVEEFLEDSVRTLLQQTYTDFEIILVDDCSPDNSPAICDKIAEQDARVRVIHLEKNGGLGNARNTGMDSAVGKYILFLDSDDFFDADMLENLVASLEKSPAQVVMFGMSEEYFDDNGEIRSTVKVSFPETTLTSAEQVRNTVVALEKSSLYGYATNKLYDLAFLRQQNARFSAVRFNEDILFNLIVFTELESCNILDITPYHYAKRANASITSRFIPTYYEHIMMKVDGLYNQFKGWDMLNEETLTLVASLYSRYFFSTLQRNLDKRMEMNRKARKQFFENELKTERYNNLRAYMGGGGLSGVMAKAFKAKSRVACFAIAGVINFIKTHFPKIFEKIN